MRSPFLALLALAAVVAGTVWSPSLYAEAQAKPLLMEGKRSLFQRVLTKPGATLHEAPGAKGQGKPVMPFTAFYVYARKAENGQNWVQVGADIHGSRQGWIASSDTLEWNQGLTLSFRDPKGNDRVLLFRDKDSLKALVESKDKGVYDKLYKAAVAGKAPEDSGVIAIQPDRHIDILKDFYLVPIARHEDVYLGAEQARMLEVATVPLQAKDPAESEFRAGVAFVVDTTLSMQPYIERTREAVRKIFKTLNDNKANGRMRFGLIAYRDDPKAVEGVEYLTRTYATLQDGTSAENFLAKVREVKASPVSTREFSEDAYAGVKQAIESLDWSGLAGRYLVLITDAGARDPGNPNASTGLDAAALRKLAQEKGIAITVLHLLTPQGADNHASATAQYKVLADYPGVGELYYGVDTGDVAKFGTALDSLAAQISAQVQKTGALPDPTKADANDPQLRELQARIAKLGYALRMQYLAKTDAKGGVPTTFNAWLLDRDFRKPERSPVEVRVLLTRDQLSDLHDTMRRLLQTFEDGLISPRGFLEDLKSLAATVSRDPKRLGEATRVGGGANLSDLGFMQEYVEDLPYRGEIMNVSLEDWESWPPKRQIELVHRLEEKIAYYKTVHDHTDLWVSLDGGPVGGNSVFPLELDMLP